MSFDVVIVGAGPGGLACAKRAASLGLSTLVLERKRTVGKKVCAGGITWNGLMQKVPAAFCEREFASQQLYTRYQKTVISSSTPILATVNREKFGQQMAVEAQNAGVVIELGCLVTAIDSTSICYFNTTTQKTCTEQYSYLVGADGSSSTVRRYLELPVTDIGIGINYQIPGVYPNMEWHLNSSLFGSGYGWIFPHLKTISIGAYVDSRVMRARELKTNLICWSKSVGFDLKNHKPRAETINFDFKGYRFGNIFLVGDAAGLASALTGEGIYPAIISGEAVADFIRDPLSKTDELDMLIKNHIKHKKMVALAGKSRVLSTLLSEIVAMSFKTGMLDFRSMEMA